MAATNAHHTTPAPYTPPDLGEDDERHRLRVLVDEVATTRGLILQLALRAMTYHSAPDAAAKAQVGEELRSLSAHFQRNYALVFGTTPHKDHPSAHVALIRKAAARAPERQEQMHIVLAHVAKIDEDVAAGRDIPYPEARRFLVQCWPVARDVLTQIIWDIWADIDSRRQEDLDAANTTVETLGTRLTRLEHIGKHVRLVSLNASVEAARAGDVGKGLMVIAQEFKVLAEEIQNLAQVARDDINGLSEHAASR